MLEAFLIIIVGIALIFLHFEVKRRAVKTVQELKQSLAAQKPADHDRSRAARNWHSARDLLAGAERRLDERLWDRAEELCELAFALLDSSARGSRHSSAHVPTRRKPSAAPARSLKLQNHAWSGGGRH